MIESDKREGKENKIETILPYSKELFTVPSNLYIIGTMNTADRSIALIDTALRRRFEFKEIIPDHTLLSDDLGGVNLQFLLRTMNSRIEYLFDRDHTIGHSYLMKAKSLADLCEVFAYKIIPLLQEYFYNDWEKIRLVLGDNRYRSKQQSGELKAFLVEKEGFNASELFGESGIEDLEDQVAYQINEELLNGNFTAEDFRKIYQSE